MDFRSLSSFICVAEELHFGRAARKLHVSQPALSQRIRQLEESIGALMFERDRRRVALTPAGNAFLPQARMAVAHAAAARTEALRAARGESGRLRIGFTVIAFHGALPQAVRDFRSRFPDVEVSLAEMNSNAVEAALSTGEIDVGVLHPPVGAPDLVIQPLAAEPLLLALPADHRLARLRKVPLAELHQEPLLMSPRPIGPHAHDRLLRLFRQHDVHPRIVQEVSPMTTLTGLVAAGCGCGFVTRGVASSRRPGVVFRPVSPEPPEMPMAAAWHVAGASTSCRAFIDTLVEAAS